MSFYFSFSNFEPLIYDETFFFFNAKTKLDYLSNSCRLRELY